MPGPKTHRPTRSTILDASVSPADARQHVLATAARLFAEHGFGEVTMAEIAETAGVARASVFNYFGSKHAIVEALTEEVILVYRDMLDEALADETTPTPELMRGLFATMAAGIENDRRLYRGVFREIAKIHLGLVEGNVAQQANQQTKARILRLVGRGQARGELTNDLDSSAVAAAFHSLSNGTITDWLYNDDGGSLEDAMARAIEVVLSPVAIEADRAPRTKRRRGGS